MERRLQPTNRSIDEITESMQKSFIEKYGRLFTEEEAIAYVDNIRKELRKEDEISNEN